MEFSMKESIAVSKIVLLLPLLALLAGRADSQALESIKSQAELDKTIASLDAALFDSYNRCDLEKFSTFFTDDVEFYHDQGGVTLGKEKLTESVKKNICGSDVRRELVPGTLQAHHMKGYGAVEIGVHRFYHPKSNTTTGEARFIHLWQYKDGAWKITRAISFDHHDAAK
jgi:ketosteroid isomerase-like protein